MKILNLIKKSLQSLGYVYDKEREEFLKIVDKDLYFGLALNMEDLGDNENAIYASFYIYSKKVDEVATSIINTKTPMFKGNPMSFRFKSHPLIYSNRVGYGDGKRIFNNKNQISEFLIDEFLPYFMPLISEWEQKFQNISDIFSEINLFEEKSFSELFVTTFLIIAKLIDDCNYDKITKALEEKILAYVDHDSFFAEQEIEYAARKVKMIEVVTDYFDEHPELVGAANEI